MALLIFGALLCLLPQQPTQAAPVSAGQYQSEVSRVAPGKGRVALTFDADWFAGRTWDILNTLHAYHAHATFFLTGHYLDTFPIHTLGIAQAGEEIASHGYDHRDYRAISDAGIVSRLENWDARYHSLTGRYGPAFWRAPYGYSDNRVRSAAASAGYRTIYWTLDSLDTVGPPKSSSFVFRQLTQSWVNLDGAILLLHVNSDGTVNALPRVLATLEARGLQVVNVSTLLGP